jgi:hypothetical protein
VYDEATRLVDDHQDFVFVDDRDRNRLRYERNFSGSGKIDNDSVPGPRTVALADRLGTDSDPARGDQ